MKIIERILVMLAGVLSGGGLGLVLGIALADATAPHVASEPDGCAAARILVKAEEASVRESFPDAVVETTYCRQVPDGLQRKEVVLVVITRMDENGNLVEDGLVVKYALNETREWEQVGHEWLYREEVLVPAPPPPKSEETPETPEN